MIFALYKIKLLTLQLFIITYFIKTIMKKYLFLLLFLFLSIFAFSQKYQVKSLDITDGLSSDYVLNMAMDKYGFIWVATEEGLNRFDGSRFYTYYKHNSDNSITGNELNCVLDDPKDNKMWIGTQREGLNVFDYDTDKFSSYRHDKKDRNSIVTNDITSISASVDSSIWVTTYWGGIEYFDKSNQHFIHYNKKNVRGLPSNQAWSVCDAGNGLIYVGHVYDGLSVIDTHNRVAHNYKHNNADPNSISGNEIHCIFRDKNGNVWIGTNNGLDLFDTLNGKFIHYDDGGKAHHPIFSIKQMSDGKLWLATEQGGVAILDINAGMYVGNANCKYDFIQEGNGELDLTGNSVRCVLEDEYHNVWLGLYGAGINFITRNTPLFSLLNYSPVNPEKHISTKSVIGLGFDTKGNLLVGTDGDGMNVFDTEKNRIHSNISLPGRSVQVVHRDKNGNIWIGCFSDNAYVRRASGGLSKIFKETVDVRCFCEDGNVMWVGTSSGIYTVDINTLKVIKAYKIKESLVRTICLDSKHNLWIGTFGDGLVKYDHSIRHKHAYSTDNGFPSNTVNGIIRGNDGAFWLATGEGVVCFPDEHKNLYKVYKQDNNLNNTNIRAIAQDRKGNVWVSTNKGISCLKKGETSFLNYGYKDNVALGNYNPSSVTTSPTGIIYFGSTRGLTYFNPSEVLSNNAAPKVFITAVDLPLGEKALSDSTINLIGKKQIELGYNDNTFTLHFNVRDYSLLGRVEYSYRLNGLQGDWQTTEDNVITFRDIPYGSYTLEVRCRRHNQEWTTDVATLDLTVNPPFWLSWWAKLIYTISIISLAVYIFRSYSRKMRLEYLLSSEKRKHEQQQELNDERLRFFTNITHELRTPLTLILGPLDDFSHSNELSDKVKHKLAVINRSAKRLQELINQILEFRKTETDNRRLCVVRGNIVSAVHEVMLKYEELNRNESVRIRFVSAENDIKMYFDNEVINMVIDNLISNAIKYTDRGEIIVCVERVINDGRRMVQIAVHDTGHGISADALPHIFERYYQENSPHQASGTGIGLALVKSLVALHQGQISVDSSVEHGSHFIISLAEDNIYPDALHGEQTSDESDDAEENGALVEKREDADENSREILLVVEDNKDIREYIATSFADKYEVFQAEDGRGGLAIALDVIPDIIISDVMMPNMDGNELCKILKNDQRTSHIPVILLTAKVSNDAKEEGYDAGADSYITKPFSVSLVESRINNLLEQRRRLLNSANDSRSGHDLSLSEKNEILKESMNKVDQEFFDNLNKILDDNISGVLDVNFLTEKLNMSTSTLYRKMKALTGISINEYVRHYKMQHAEKLLLKNTYTINEITYMVGLSSVTYFRKCFKEDFGYYPTEYLKKIKAAGKS